MACNKFVSNFIPNFSTNYYILKPCLHSILNTTLLWSEVTYLLVSLQSMKTERVIWYTGRDPPFILINLQTTKTGRYRLPFVMLSLQVLSIFILQAHDCSQHVVHKPSFSPNSVDSKHFGQVTMIATAKCWDLLPLASGKERELAKASSATSWRNQKKTK